MTKLLLAAAMALFAAPLAAQTPTAVPAAPAAVDYAADASWICLPDRPDACARPLPTAALEPAGYGPVSSPARAGSPPIDCFYVYPTVSRDAELNSDLTPGPTEEVGVAIVQFARFGSLCRTFAPLYRQATLASIPRALMGGDVTANTNLAYGDVRAAFHYYLEHHNQGRPFVLIGHSQGSIHLARLIAAEIDGTPLATRMVSALLIGWTIEVPEGAVVGGTFRQIPLCTREGQTGCVISYMTFRASAPPPNDALLGRATRPGMTAACTNPAALAGGSAPLNSIWFAAPSGLPGATPFTWSTSAPPPAPFLSTRGLASGECRHQGAKGYLAITVNADAADARTDDIPGDVRIAGIPQPGWGLHTADMSLTQGDLMEVVAAQSATATRGR